MWVRDRGSGRTKGTLVSPAVYVPLYDPVKSEVERLRQSLGVTLVRRRKRMSPILHCDDAVCLYQDVPKDSFRFGLTGP